MIEGLAEGIDLSRLRSLHLLVQLQVYIVIHPDPKASFLGGLRISAKLLDSHIGGEVNRSLDKDNYGKTIFLFYLTEQWITRIRLLYDRSTGESH